MVESAEERDEGEFIICADEISLSLSYTPFVSKLYCAEYTLTDV
jgi:hypothetical protein